MRKKNLFFFFFSLTALFFTVYFLLLFLFFSSLLLALTHAQFFKMAPIPYTLGLHFFLPYPNSRMASPFISSSFPSFHPFTLFTISANHLLWLYFNQNLFIQLSLAEWPCLFLFFFLSAYPTHFGGSLLIKRSQTSHKSWSDMLIKWALEKACGLDAWCSAPNMKGYLKSMERRFWWEIVKKKKKKNHAVDLLNGCFFMIIEGICGQVRILICK